MVACPQLAGGDITVPEWHSGFDPQETLRNFFARAPGRVVGEIQSTPHGLDSCQTARARCSSLSAERSGL